MKNYTPQQEILLVNNTTLSKRQLMEKGDFPGSCRPSFIEQLEGACWQGFLNELVPEIMHKSLSGTDLFIWHICQGTSFLKIEKSEVPLIVELQSSIDPYFFLANFEYN